MRISRLLIYILAAGIVYSLFLLASAPMRKNISNRFLERGETYLSQRQYEEAILEFEKSLKYNSNNLQARQDAALTREVVLDISQGLSFLKVHNKELADKITEAQKNFPQAKAALEFGISNLESGDTQIALISFKKAIEMDSAYPEAWKFLTKAYQESKKSCPESIKNECQSYFAKKYQESQKKLAELDPTTN